MKITPAPSSSGSASPESVDEALSYGWIDGVRKSIDDVSYVDSVRLLKRNETAWRFFQAQPPYSWRVAAHYVSSAKREETRARRLAALIEHSAKEQRIPQFVSLLRRV